MIESIVLGVLFMWTLRQEMHLGILYRRCHNLECWKGAVMQREYLKATNKPDDG